MRNHESVFSRSTAVVNSRIATGLTVIEVLFAMVIILVGLVGVAAMIPFAIRQAEDSYRITHGLAAGENALGVLKSQSVVQPRMDAPWQFVNDEWADGDSKGWAVTSWNNFYQLNEYSLRLKALGLSGDLDTTQNRNAIALLQNQIIGTSFCIDPLFWGYQERGVKLGINSRGNYRRSRFPFYREGVPNSLDPFDTNLAFETPRMRRVSIADPMGPDANGNSGWLRLPSSLQLSAVSGGDIAAAKPDEDKSAAPLRGEYVDGAGALMQSPTNAASVSWMATLTPSDNTPIIRPTSLTYNPNNLSLAPPIEIFPESYDLAVVVFGKRDVREQLDPTTLIVPESERLGLMLGVPNDLEYLTSGTFDITIDSGANVDPKIKVGDWLMLSRYIYLTNPASNPIKHTDAKLYATRERHKWYRVLSVAPDDTFPKSVRLSGQPWDYTEQELADARVIDPTLASLKMPQTTVTLLKNVLQVFQRTVYLQTY
ncbi:MAG: hypothetical protein WCK15_13895 [Pirellula sp.]